MLPGRGEIVFVGIVDLCGGILGDAIDVEVEGEARGRIKGVEVGRLRTADFVESAVFVVNAVVADDCRFRVEFEPLARLLDAAVG